MSRVALVALLLLVPATAGCLEGFPEGIGDSLQKAWESVSGSGATVIATTFSETDWNHNGYFSARVATDEAAELKLTLKPLDGVTGEPLEVIVAAEVATFDNLTSQYLSEIEMTVPDGEWILTLRIDGKLWKQWDPLRVDATPPAVTGLKIAVRADEQGNYVIGAAAVWEDGATVIVRDPAGSTVATNLPYTTPGLTDGIHPYVLTFQDPAGNQLIRTVQVLAGDAVELPDGQFTVGIVARYSNSVELWDISEAGRSNYLPRSQAATAQPNYLGSGQGIDPDDPAVKNAVASVVTSDMNTMEAAIALYQWLYDEVEYDEERLSSTTLMTPSQVLLDTEDPDDTDADGDGLVDDGAGNGVKGGVCRDLAATYVSLLRAAGVPARLITGYLAGNVNGFHAWIEFYAGAVDNQGPWVPVDISSVDGQWSDDEAGDGNPDGISSMVQSFGIRLPHYLPLRALPAAAESDEGWSTALGLSYRYSGDGDLPDYEFTQDITVEAQVAGYLCFDVSSIERKTVARSNLDSCNGLYYFGGSDERPFLIQTTQVIDYGIELRDPGDAVDMTIQLAYPFKEEVRPVVVDTTLVYVNHVEPNGSVPNASDGDVGKKSVTLHW